MTSHWGKLGDGLNCTPKLQPNNIPTPAISIRLGFSRDCALN
jgi:hypothetical protein